MNHVNIAKLNVHHLGCRHGFLSIQYSKPLNINHTNCNFRAIRQILDSPIIPRTRYQISGIVHERKLSRYVDCHSVHEFSDSVKLFTF